MATSKRIRWAKQVAWMGQNSSAYRLFVGKSEEKRPLERLRRENGWIILTLVSKR
jgi:hypothetical protein